MKMMEVLKKENPTIDAWGAIGLCWGSKIVSLTSGAGSPFAAGAECHPAMVDPADAEKITIPICMLPSKDESKEDFEKFHATLKPELKKKSVLEVYDDQVHGWMGARGLSDENATAKYKQGYATVLKFFHDTL